MLAKFTFTPIMTSMSETPAEQPVPTLADVLSDGKMHPIMSGLSAWQNEPVTFWISEKPEKPLHPEDHDEARCYRVDLQPLRWMRDGEDLSYIGTCAVLGSDVEVQVLTIGDFAYAYNRTLSMQRYEAAQAAREAERS